MNPVLPAPRPVYLTDLPEPALALFHGPVAGAPGGAGVLLCPPFGWEEVCSYRSRREWACRLARGGRPALRLDLPGTGDSGGSSGDADLLEAWVSAVGAAAGWLREDAGCERVVAIGIGLGGLLALRSAAAGSAVDDLVLWGVPARGRTLVRELRAFALLNEKAAEGPDSADPPPPEGHIETGGFLLTPQTAAALGAIDLSKLALPDAEGRRVLVLERDGIEADERLVSHLRDEGATVAVAAGRGYGAMMAHPQDSRPPLETFARVDEWLAAIEAPRIASAAAAPGSGPGWAELAVGDAYIRETPIAIEMPFGRLFGVLAEPLGRFPADTCAVLLNAGALRRIGPGRMWVEIARRWAARGVTTLRLDLEGIGDADGDDTRYADVAALYVPEFVDQVIAALDALESRETPSRFLLCGLCSGAYWGFHTALRDERVRAAFLINPRVLYWDEALLAKREVRKTRKLLMGSSWRRILRGEVSLARFAELGRWALLALARMPGQMLSRRSRRRQLDRALDGLRDAGKRVLFVFGEREPLRDELEREERLGRARWPNLELQLVPGRHHALEPITAQARVHAVLDRALEEELARPGGSSEAPGPPLGSATGPERDRAPSVSRR